jgi:hypothetical protein
VAAILLAAVLVDEPITWNLLPGIIAAFAGIGIATAEPARAARVAPPGAPSRG